MLSPLRQQVAQAERKLAVGVAGGVPDFELQATQLDHVAVVDQLVELDRRHFQVDVLGGDFGERLDPIAGGQRLGRQRMADDRRLQDLIELGQPLDVIDVGVGGDQHPALRQRKIELADQLDDLVDRFLEADVDQQPIGTVVDQIDVAAQPLAGLVVDLDHMGENRFTLQHELRSSTGKNSQTRRLRPSDEF